MPSTNAISTFVRILPFRHTMDLLVFLKVALAIGLVLAWSVARSADDPQPTRGQASNHKADYEPYLQESDVKRAAELAQAFEIADQSQQFDEALRCQAQLLALLVDALGNNHWTTRNQKLILDGIKAWIRLTEPERLAWQKALQAKVKAQELDSKGQYARATPFWRKYLQSCKELFGESQPATVDAFSGIAKNLSKQHKYIIAEEYFKKTLELRCALFGEQHPSSAEDYKNLACNSCFQHRYPEAIASFEKALEIQIGLFGENHPAVADYYVQLANGFLLQDKYSVAYVHHKHAVACCEKLGDRHPETVRCLALLAYTLRLQGNFVEAQPLFEKVTSARVELLGEQHPDTADSYLNLGENLVHLNRYAEAQPFIEKALTSHLARFGEMHIETADGHYLLGTILASQSGFDEAQPHFEKAISAQRALLGEKHFRTANSYFSLGRMCLSQTRFAEAEVFFGKALSLYVAIFGEKSVESANAFRQVAISLMRQQKSADAQPLLEKAVELHVKLYGDKHPATSSCLVDMAYNLSELGRYEDGREIARKVIVTDKEVYGENHASVSAAYNALAVNLYYDNKADEARECLLKAMAINTELYGESHESNLVAIIGIANCLFMQSKYHEAQQYLERAVPIAEGVLADRDFRANLLWGSLGYSLMKERKYDEAQVFFERALSCAMEVNGNNHHATVSAMVNVGWNFFMQRKYYEAQQLLDRAAESFESARLSAAGRGLERAVYAAKHSPYRLLTEVNLELGSRRAAWNAFERDVARGLNEELAVQRRFNLTADEDNQRAQLSARFEELLRRRARIADRASSPSENEEVLQIVRERVTVESQLAKIAAALSVREVAELEKVQAAIPVDGAIVCWLIPRGSVVSYDGQETAWGGVVRQSGEPQWVRLPGSGPRGAWTDNDGSLAEELRDSVAFGTATESEISALAQKLRSQRLVPLAKLLVGVTSVYVVGVDDIAGVPLDLMTTDFTISYIPSGTFLARIKDREPVSKSGLLAIGDPVFVRPTPEPERKAELPPSGLLISEVTPGGLAKHAELRSGDVLVQYGGCELSSIEQCNELVQAHAKESSVTISFWREGQDQLLLRNVSSGQLGVKFDEHPAREEIAERQKTTAMLTKMRGGQWSDLPGTRFEVKRIAKLFGDLAITRFDSDASEQMLEEFRNAGELSEFRYLHFATHGAANSSRAFESVLILAQDNLGSDPVTRAGEALQDGQLSANEVLQFWKLNCDLVTLSACETALGRNGGGEGLLGFAQAFLKAGSRSVCLSLWKVDDTATALLMTRFYQNLLGKREGLLHSMPKAKALAEAKEWLRGLSTEEALRLTASETGEIDRGTRAKGETLKLVAPIVGSGQPESKPKKPFSHPRFWSSFVLIGDPN